MIGGYGKIVEIDEGYFPGWEDIEKWGFGLVEHGNLNAIMVQVPPNRSRDVLLPIINKHCLDGTVFCSDGLESISQIYGTDNFVWFHISF